jgi:hypothetical protein
MCYHGADLVEGLRIVDISYSYRHYLIPRRSLKNALTEKGSGYYVAGIELNSWKKGAGIKCPGKKRLVLLSPEPAPMGLTCLRKKETAKNCP